MSSEAMPTAQTTVPITVEFTGGLEMLFSNQKKHNVEIPTISSENDSSPASPPTIQTLVTHLCDKVMTDSRIELFVLDGTVRPGILVLINDADWELEGESNYELKKADHILFVSTLHGG